MTVALGTPFREAKRVDRAPGATLQHLFESNSLPTHLPVICLVNREPVLRRDSGWDIVPATDAEVAFVTLPLGGSGGTKDIVRYVAIAALVLSAPYLAGGIASVLGPTGVVGAAGAIAVPTFGVSATTLGLIQAGIVIGGTVLINAVLPPGRQSNETGPQASPTYSLSPSGNQARLGAPIPRIAGRHIITCDLAAPQWTEYRNNQQYLHGLYTASVGLVEVDQVLIEKTALWTLQDGLTGHFPDVEMQIVEPGQPVTVYRDIYYTCPEVNGQELRMEHVGPANTVFTGGVLSSYAPKPNEGSEGPFQKFVPGDIIAVDSGSNIGSHTVVGVSEDEASLITSSTFIPETTSAKIIMLGWVGPFDACPAGEKTDLIAIDLALPRGLYRANDKGKLSSYSVSVEIQVQPIDQDGQPIGAWVRLGADDHMAAPQLSFSGQFSRTYTMATNTPQRLTEQFPVAYGRYRVRVRRLTAFSVEPRNVNDISWIGLRARLPDDHVYADVTLVAMKMRATNNLSQQNSRQIRVVATGKAPVWNGSTWSEPVATRSIAWHTADLLRNDVYGEGLPDSQIDLDKLLALDATWASRGDSFDGVFDTERTTWEALRALLRVGRTQPALVAGKVTFTRDEPRALARGVLSPVNLNGFSVEHILFDDKTPDDIIAEFMDERTWSHNSVRCTLPGSLSENPKRENYFGIVKRNHVWREGIYDAACNAKRRIFASLTTEMEGRILVRGDQVVVGHDLMRWGQSGTVQGRDGYVLSLSDELDWGDDEGDRYLLLRQRNGAQWGPVLVSEGDAADEIVIDADDLIAVEADFGKTLGDVLVPADMRGRMVETSYLFGSSIESFRKFLVVGGKFPDFKTSQLTLVNDDPSVHEADLGSPPGETIEDAPVAPGAPAKVIGLDAGLNSGTDPVTLDVVWGAAAGATTYVIESSPNGVAFQHRDQVAGTSAVITVPAGVIFLRVAGVAGEYTGPWSDVFGGSFSSTTATPGAVLDLDSNMSLGDGVFVASWLAAARAESYELELRTEAVADSGNFNVVETTLNVAGTFVTLGGAEIAALGGPWPRYQVRVKGINPDGNGPTASLTVTGVGLDAITGLALVGLFEGGEATIQWNPLLGATSYVVAVRPDGGTAVRTLTVTTNALNYSAAWAAADGSPWDSIRFDVHAEGGLLVSPTASLTVVA